MENKEIGEVLFQYLKSAIYTPRKELDIRILPEEFEKVGMGLLQLREYLLENETFGEALARGDLDVKAPSVDNKIAAPLKEIQGNLRHITWQTKQVAKGDYGQQVDFLGEFSASFNEMIEQLKERRDLLEREAYRDSLTGAYNRLYARKYMTELIEKQEEFCISFMDIDGLKYCNDTYGHEEGDSYIIKIFDCLKDGKTEKEAVCRLGGDEFLLISPEADMEKLENRMEEKSRRFSENGKDEPYPQGFSFGCARMDYTADTMDSLIKRADERMYERKMKKKKLYGCE